MEPGQISATSTSSELSTSSPTVAGKKTGETIMAAFIILTLLVAGVALFFTAKSIFFSPAGLAASITTGAVAGVADAPEERNAPEEKRMSSLSFTAFDTQLAKQFMDKNNDGKCDSCGMPIEQCMDSGQLQCNMDPASTIGLLNSDHLHADWKIYINGKTVDLSDKDHMGRMRSGSSVSSFIHVDSGAPELEKTGDLLHMHASGVPLWIFFESVGMKFDKSCLQLDSGENSGKKYCTDDKNSLKFYVNGQPNDQYEQYVFKDLDKILISYGPLDEDLKAQLASVTNFAGVH